MEVIDDEADDLMVAMDDKPAAEQATVTAPKIYPNVVAKLTREEERAMAMEQMAGLKNRANERQRRRKQDIKPLALEGSDLVTSLGAEWSDDDTGQVGAPSPSAATANTKAITKSPNTKQPEAVVPAKLTETVVVETDEPKSSKSALPKVTNVVVLQSAKVKPAEEKKTEVTPPAPQVSTGFKRTRIIKRKIIWDPDETQFSYAALVRSSGKNKAETTSSKGAASPSTTGNIKKEPPAKKEVPAKKVRPSTPKDKKLTSTIAVDAAEKKPPRSATPQKHKAEAGKVTTSTNVTPSTKSSADEESIRGPSPIKRRSQTPVANGAGATKKKKISEIDRLMGDEGAVNMLNALESERGKASPETSSPDKPHKPLMRSRAATICERITKRETTPTKKDLPAATKNKRGSKQKASSSWDYVYKAQATDDAMIIRRRSNSSYSSTASLHRSSLDGPATPKVNTKSASASSTPASVTPVSTPNSASKSASKASPKSLNTTSSSVTEDSPAKSSATSSKLNSPKSFEFAKPESKSNQKQNRHTKSPSQPANPLASDMKKGSSPSAAAASKRAAVRSPSTLDKEKTTKSPSTKEDSAAAAISDVFVKKIGKVAQIVFNTDKAKLEFAFTAQMMNKLVEILDKLSTDKDCNAVVMTTTAPNFCQGIDFTDLTVGSADKRKQTAVQLATAAKNYLKTLATFPKPLIAGVNGHNIGLGVTQLPLFDIVIASDRSSFEAPYAKIGQVPEGFCIWNNITKVRGTFKTKLFWLCEKLHSTETCLSGVVNRLTASNKVNEDALSVAKKITAMSAESYRVMKKATIHNHLDAVISALDEEFDTIINQWSGPECYENFKKYLHLGHL